MVLGKPKYNVGRRGNTSSMSIRLQLCLNKRTDVLLPVIQKHVKPQPTIMSDCWASYNCLMMQGYNHLTVNYGLHIVEHRLTHRLWNPNGKC